MHEVLCAELQAHGVDITFEQCLINFMGQSIEDVIATAKALGANLRADWKHELYGKVHARLAAGVDLIPGVPEFVEALKSRGVPFCVASNGSKAKMQLMLSQHGLWEEFRDVCFSAQTLGVSKPDPGLLNHALTVMGAPQNPVVIEDSLVGLEAARAAGVPAFLFCKTEVDPRAYDLATRSFQQMSALADYLLGPDSC